MTSTVPFAFEDSLVADVMRIVDGLASDLTNIPDWWDEIDQIERHVRDAAGKSDLAEISPMLAALVAEMTIETLREAVRIPQRRVVN